ncbi:hypothetical protein BDR04DRAFT_1119883 [Suillus decipiens]|nr:hypothetical protein BDR04DRAFT_1119883 [Suillus decipiens]
MLPGAIGWVYDNNENFSQEYALKDCWVNENVKDVKIQLLKAVEGIPNVVQLKKYWDVLYDGKPNSAWVPLTHFNNVPELIGVFCDLVVDFDHAKFLNDDGKVDLSPCGTGTVPYISFHILHLMRDGPKGILAPQPSPEALQQDAIWSWAVSYEKMTQDGLMTSSIWKQEFINGLADPPLITPYFTLCCPLLEECPTLNFILEVHSMPPRKKARHASPLWSLSSHNSRTRKSTQGVGGYVTQLKKAGEILMAPARQQRGRGAVKISDSEVNSMAPLQQLKKGKKKADMNFLPHPVEDDNSQSNTQCCNPFIHIASPDDRFGFKSSSTDKQDPWEATQPISCSSKKAIEDEVRKDRM